MTRKQKRLVTIAGLGTVLAVAVGLILFALSSQISFFYSPSQAKEAAVAPGTAFRLGGMVKEGTWTKTGETSDFVVTDGETEMPVRFVGLLPDLFREGQGVVADGALGADGTFAASRVLANAARAIDAGLGRARSTEPPALYSYDPDIGRLAVTTPSYNTAIVAVNQRAFPYGGLDLARLFDGNHDVAANIGGTPPASFGALVATYQARKAEVGALDFEDLLVCTRDLVRDQGEVRRGFQERYRCIFVDEFQDTDPLQAEILMLLAADDPSVRAYRDVQPVPGKLFLVGDPKQAIYRFRRADLSVYEEVKELVVRRGALFVELSTSFRSVPSIQKLVNTAFAPVMVGDREALSARYVPLRPAR